MKGEHRHGGDPREDFRRFGLTPRPTVDFSANLSPFGPPDPVRRLWPELLRQVEHYPSLSGEGVVSFFSQRFGFQADRVLAGNGATELIYLIPRALAFRRVAVLRPAYADYERACRVAGATIEPLDLDPMAGFAAPGRRQLAEVLTRVEAVFIGHPNNPTGTLFDVDVVRELAIEQPDVMWVVDESFIQLTDAFPSGSLAFGSSRAPGGWLPPNVLVVLSLTKTYALAGLRLGAVIAEPSVLDRLRLSKEPWSVNGVADRVARELVHCTEYEQRLRLMLCEERENLVRGLSALGTVEVFSPTANFILARWREGPLDPILRGLLRQGFCVRDCRNFVGLGDGYFRLAVRTPEDNRALLGALSRLEP